MPGGALEVISAGALDGVGHVYGLHCDPTIDVGQVGLRVGPLTGAADALTVRLTGRGGHTSRPHLTEDLTFALGKLVTELPGVLSRRLDPRAGASLVWGVVRAGVGQERHPVQRRGLRHAADARRRWPGRTPRPWSASSSTRCSRRTASAPRSPTSAACRRSSTRPGSTALLRQSVAGVLGDERVVSTTQSLGGEDFAWYLESIPGAMGRLGTRTPGGATYDLHQGDLRIDERAVAIGAKVLAAAAVETITHG